MWTMNEVDGPSAFGRPTSVDQADEEIRLLKIEVSTLRARVTELETSQDHFLAFLHRTEDSIRDRMSKNVAALDGIVAHHGEEAEGSTLLQEIEELRNSMRARATGSPKRRRATSVLPPPLPPQPSALNADEPLRVSEASTEPEEAVVDGQPEEAAVDDQLDVTMNDASTSSSSLDAPLVVHRQDSTEVAAPPPAPISLKRRTSSLFSLALLDNIPRSPIPTSLKGKRNLPFGFGGLSLPGFFSSSTSTSASPPKSALLSKSSAPPVVSAQTVSTSTETPGVQAKTLYGTEALNGFADAQESRFDSPTFGSSRRSSWL